MVGYAESERIGRLVGGDETSGGLEVSEALRPRRAIARSRSDRSRLHSDGGRAHECFLE